LCVCPPPSPPPPPSSTPKDNLDDEISVSTFENRLNSLDEDSLTQLTSDNFHAAVARSGLTVALFHLPCKWRSSLSAPGRRSGSN